MGLPGRRLALVSILMPFVAACGTPTDDTNRQTTGADPSAAEPSAERSPKRAEITGFGAKREAWLSAHEQAPGFAEGSAFLPMVTREGSELPYYGGVILDDLVLSYTLNLPSGTDLASAKARAIDEFPAGAKFGLVDDGEPTCLIVVVESPPVRKAMRRGGWGNWVPAAVFGTSTASKTKLDPSEVTDVTLLPLEPSRDLGRC